VRFWDSSAVVPLLIEEAASPQMEVLLADNSLIAVWWGTPVECLSAIARRERAGGISSVESARGEAKLATLSERWVEVPPTEHVRQLASRLLRLHELRAGDTFQLAAAMITRDGDDSLAVVTLDDRLAAAARREGFPIRP
jgi:uncharacterized protein